MSLTYYQRALKPIRPYFLCAPTAHELLQAKTPNNLLFNFPFNLPFNFRGKRLCTPTTTLLPLRALHLPFLFATLTPSFYFDIQQGIEGYMGSCTEVCTEATEATEATEVCTEATEATQRCVPSFYLVLQQGIYTRAPEKQIK